MKQYDVFISYSRRDIDEANRLCAELDAADINYWIDRNIHGSANFLSEITAHIRRCRVVLFIASNNSANSEWTQKEILFALKHKKQIIPYRIGEFSFESNDELDFVFSNVQWLESCSDVVRDICEICGIKQAKPQPSTEEIESLHKEETERTKEHEELERKVAELQLQIQLQAERQRKQSEEQNKQRSNGQNKQHTSPLITIKRPIRWVVTSTLVLCIAILGIALYNHQIDKVEAEVIAQELLLAEEKAEQQRLAAEEEAAKREQEQEKEKEKHKADNAEIKNALLALNYSDKSVNIIIANSDDNLIFRSEILNLIERYSKGLITTKAYSVKIDSLIETYASEAKRIEQERLAKEKAEQERIAQLVREAEERGKAEAERQAKAEAEAKRKAEQERIAAEKAEAERKAKEQEEQLKKDIANWTSLGDKAFQEENYAEALKWYRKADEQGNARAQFYLGQRYYDSKNYTEAFKWFKKAAEGGDAYAQNWMGHCYEFGYGVQKNKKTAIEWYKKSAQSGLDTSAKEHLERLGVNY